MTAKGASRESHPRRRRRAPTNDGGGGTSAPFLPEELVRYGRHLILPEVGAEGQRKLRAAKVLVVGAGGLGTPAALYLAAAGVGEIGVVDGDVVELSNLPRQVLYSTEDVGRPKVVAAKERLESLNPHSRIVARREPLTSKNVLRTLRPYDVIVDGSDNFPTRYLVNDAAVLLGKPDIFGAVDRFEGQLTVFDAARGPCYRCLFPEPPRPDAVPACAEAGVLGVLPGLVGVLQATEALKLILGRGRPMIGRLLLFDALGLEVRELKVGKNPRCALCSKGALSRDDSRYPASPRG